MNKKPILGITLGDPSGIGPEISIKALNLCSTYDICRPLIIGDAAVLQKAVNQFDTANTIKINSVSQVSDCLFKHGTIDIIDTNTINNTNIANLQIGKVDILSGEAAFASVKKVIELAMQGAIDATITNPINKEAINLAGHHYAGHTEIYADLTGTKKYTMMLVHENLHVVHVSTHVALREACNLVKKERVISVIEMAHNACLQLGIDKPNIAVAALNPHAGENGLFGREEIEEISPAIIAANSKGINAFGPIPPDTVFSKAHGGIYDIVVAMYHDQGHIPLKVLGFQYDKNNGKCQSVNGVNITLGLPIIRSSVDHGTAFGKAWKGTASEESLVSAIGYGVKLAETKRN